MVAWSGLSFNRPYQRRGQPDIAEKTLHETHFDFGRGAGLPAGAATGCGDGHRTPKSSNSTGPLGVM